MEREHLIEQMEQEAAREAASPEALTPEQADLHEMLLPEAGIEYVVVHPDDPLPIEQQPRLPTVLRMIVAAHELSTRLQGPVELWVWDAERGRFHGPYPYPLPADFAGMGDDPWRAF